MKTSMSFALILWCIAVIGINVSAQQQPYCYSFDQLDGFTYGSYSFWKYSNKERPTFYVPPSEDGYIWTKYTELPRTTIYKPQIILPIMRKISRTTTFSFSYYLNQITNNITINFIRSSDSARIRLGIVTTNNAKNVTSWLTYKGTCHLCCVADDVTCTGQFEIVGTNIFVNTELALSSFSVNNGSCALKQPTACYEFDSWGKWSNVQNWSLSLDGLLHPSLPSRERNYIWTDTTKPPTLNLTSPVAIGVTMNTKLSLDYFMTDSSSTIRVYFLNGNNFLAAPQKISEFSGAVDNEWDHREIKCQLASGSYCCGNYSQRCDGYFLIETASVSNGIIALDDIGVNTPHCGKTKILVTPEYAIEDGIITGRGQPGRGRFNIMRKDGNSMFSFNYNF